MRQWVARVGKQFSVGGYAPVDSFAKPAATVTLHGRMAESGAHDGREIDIMISPEVLDDVARLVAAAIAVRDAVKAT